MKRIAPNVFCKISVYYTYSDEKFKKLYDKLKDDEYPHYDFVLESKTDTVNEVTKLICETKIQGCLNFFQFLVDDMLFFK